MQKPFIIGSSIRGTCIVSGLVTLRESERKKKVSKFGGCFFSFLFLLFLSSPKSSSSLFIGLICSILSNLHSPVHHRNLYVTSYSIYTEYSMDR